MKRIIIAAACLALSAATLLPVSAGNASAVTPEEAQRVIALAFERGITIYKKYTGIEYSRKETVSEYDPATKKLKSVSEITMKRKDYFYKEPEIEVLTYRKDGKEMDPSKFRVMKSMPLYPAFDEKGNDNYRFTVVGKVRHSGKECYCIQVEPRIISSRHFRGSIYATVNNLDMVSIEGTMAKLDFPIKEFHIALEMKNVDGVPIARSGEVHVRVNVPVFYPDTLIVSSLETLDTKLMQ